MQRNRLLKDLLFKPEYEETLDIWDIQLVQFGKEIIQYRANFIRELNDIIKKIHRKLSGERENIQIIYDPCAYY